MGKCIKQITNHMWLRDNTLNVYKTRGSGSEREGEMIVKAERGKLVDGEIIYRTRGKENERD